MFNFNENKATAFLGINVDLIENKLYKQLDSRAMMLYSLYADRASTSLYYARLGNTAFVDDKGVFIRYTNKQAADILRVSEKLIGKLRKQLISCDLITVARDGMTGYKIYVHPVKKTPQDAERLMPWKNHNVQIVKFVSDWTTFAKIEFANNLSQQSENADITVKDKADATCRSNRPTSLSTFNISHINNYNGLIDNAPARAREVEAKPKPHSPNTSKYHSLPDEIKSAFNSVFGFISYHVASELHSLIKLSNVDMVDYAIESSRGRKITSPIAYLKAAIINALKRGDKTAEDMKQYYENMVQGLKKPRRFMTSKMADMEVAKSLKQLKQDDPEAYKRIKTQEAETKRKETEMPVIPVYRLGE